MAKEPTFNFGANARPKKPKGTAGGKSKGAKSKGGKGEGAKNGSIKLDW